MNRALVCGLVGGLVGALLGGGVGILIATEDEGEIFIASDQPITVGQA